jgi:hypothetical protein
MRESVQSISRIKILMSHFGEKIFLENFRQKMTKWRFFWNPCKHPYKRMLHADFRLLSVHYTYNADCLEFIFIDILFP